MGQLELWDQSLTLWINSFNSAWSDSIWVFFSNRFVWIPLYLAVAGLLIWRLGWKKGLLAVFGIIFTILCVDQFCNLIKAWVGRLRPCMDEGVLAQGLHVLEGASFNHRFGFFSGHSANAFAFALGSVLAFRLDARLCYVESSKTHVNPWLKAYSVCIFIWATLVAISRVFVGKHFFGDITVGFFVGLLFAYVIYLIYSKIARAYL